MMHLVIGLGEVGTAIQLILREKYGVVDGIDKNIYSKLEDNKYEVIHICFPYSINFESMVRSYQTKYLKKDGLSIIHSTVPVGTSNRCCSVHSPIRGSHPNLTSGIKLFAKYFGGERANEACEIFKQLIHGEIISVQNSRNTEALKLWDTTQYAWNILLEKSIYQYCKDNDLDFDTVYKSANETYNRGYYATGNNSYRKYVLDHVEGPIGGHCLIPNCQLLDNNLAKLILHYNKILESVELENDRTK